MFVPKFAFAGIAGAIILALSAPNAKAQFVQFGYGNAYVNPYAGNMFRSNNFYSPYGGFQRGYSNFNNYNRGSYYSRPYYNQPYYGGSNFNGGNRYRGNGLLFNPRFR